MVRVTDGTIDLAEERSHLEAEAEAARAGCDAALPGLVSDIIKATYEAGGNELSLLMMSQTITCSLLIWQAKFLAQHHENREELWPVASRYWAQEMSRELPILMEELIAADVAARQGKSNG